MDRARATVQQPAPQLDFRQIVHDAQSRWLRPQEICEVLRNFGDLNVKTSPAPPYQPRSGSLFLFDRKSLRYFRKDGHNWRKKKDGKTVKEAHERLKLGSVNALHCYYAHGEENPNFQRRSYWLLEGANEHIVLVHYLEAVQGSRSSIFRLHDHSLESQLNRQALGANGSPELAQTSPLSFEGYNSAGDDELNDADLSRASFSLSEQLSVNEQGKTSASKTPKNAGQYFTASPKQATSQLPIPITPPNVYTPSNTGGAGGFSPTNFYTPEMINDGSPRVDTYTTASDYLLHTEDEDDWSQFMKTPIAQDMGWADVLKQSIQPETCEQFIDSLVVKPATKEPAAENTDSSSKQDSSHFGNLDSFGRWMMQEFAAENSPSSDSALLSSSTYEDKTEVDTELSYQAETEPIPNVQMSDQKFTILDFSPDWAYAFEETKVLVSGEYLINRGDARWCCMFGEVEVPADVFSTGVLRCNTPKHEAGVVPFYITCNDRSACSQIKEFHFREKTEPSRTASDDAVAEDLLVRMRFVRMLHMDDNARENSAWVSASVSSEVVSSRIRGYFKRIHEEWADITNLITAGASGLHVKERIFEVFSKFKLRDWLIRRVEFGENVAGVRDQDGQGILHLAAALGFDWAVGPVLAAGVNVNFRDTRGWTALHWAAYYGRENTVRALLRGGAFPELLTDPTVAVPAGQIAANIASARGHGGIAGYLGQASVQHHFSLLTLKDGNLNEIHHTNATVAGYNAANIAFEGSNLHPTTVNDLSMKQALLAVRQTTQAAALIQSAFRQISFRRKQEIEEAELLAAQKLTAEDVQKILAAQRIQRVYRGHREKKMNTAATKIQSKYRGWKGRQEFLNKRQRVIKIQAHFRGYRVRKQYKKILWSVGVLEKVVLRWHRGRHGLRGFHAEERMVQGDDDEDDDFLRDGRKQKEQVLESAVECVQAMVHSPEARAQYLRMLSDSKLDPPKEDDVDYL